MPKNIVTRPGKVDMIKGLTTTPPPQPPPKSEKPVSPPPKPAKK